MQRYEKPNLGRHSGRQQESENRPEATAVLSKHCYLAIITEAICLIEINVFCHKITYTQHIHDGHYHINL